MTRPLPALRYHAVPSGERPRAFRRSQARGIAALEFAILFPVWFLILVAIVDFGWLFTHVALLDAAADEGCRAGALVDPGDEDAYIVDVEEAAEDRMRAAMARIGLGECVECVVSAYTAGAPPSRVLVCESRRDVHPILGVFFGPRQLTTRQVARLEWQREAAP